MANRDFEDLPEDIQEQGHAKAELAATIAAPLFKLFGWTYFDSDHTPHHRGLVRCIEENMAMAYSEGASCIRGIGRFSVRWNHIDCEFTVYLDLA